MSSVGLDPDGCGCSDRDGTRDPVGRGYDVDAVFEQCAEHVDVRPYAVEVRDVRSRPKKSATSLVAVTASGPIPTISPASQPIFSGE